MGRALKNLDGLLRMPYGCGEQNMALLAPNIYILRYLEETQQLTAPVRRKALEFLRSGEVAEGDGRSGGGSSALRHVSRLCPQAARDS